MTFGKCKCVDCGKDFDPFKKGSSDIRGSDCNSKYLKKHFEELQQIKMDKDQTVEFMIETDFRQKLINFQKKLVKKINRSQEDISLFNQTHNQFAKLSEEVINPSLFMEELFTYSAHAEDLEVRNLASDIFTYRYCAVIDPSVVKESFPDHLKFKFAHNKKTLNRTLQMLALEPDTKISHTALQTLKIKKIMGKA